MSTIFVADYSWESQRIIRFHQARFISYCIVFFILACICLYFAFGYSSTGTLWYTLIVFIFLVPLIIYGIFVFFILPKRLSNRTVVVTEHQNPPQQTVVTQTTTHHQPVSPPPQHYTTVAPPPQQQVVPPPQYNTAVAPPPQQQVVPPPHYQ